MKRSPIRLGPLALLLCVIGICLTILAVLSFTAARADLRLAQKYAETVQARYALEQQGQEYVCALNGGRVPAPEEDEDGLIRLDLEHKGFLLHLVLLPDGENGFTPVSWRQEKTWQAEETIENLWDGSAGKEW